VRTPARLHLGFLDLNASIGRKFGSIGLAVNSHYTHIKVSHADSFLISGDVSDETQHKLEALSSLFYQTLAPNIPVEQRSLHIAVIERIPEHSGLGSGTQLALALGRALAEFHQLDISTTEIAHALQRGKRSGIGISTFDRGGFVIDGGSANESDAVPPMLAHYDYPHEWRIVMILSPEFQGIHGQSEKQAFKSLPVFPLENTQMICHLTLMQLLPALAEKQLSLFGDAITKIQALVGDHFAPMQGGRYTSQGVAACLEYAHSIGYEGIAQSSWGPTGCIFVESEQQAHNLLSKLNDFFQAQNIDESLQFITVNAENTGAIVETTA
jgi:beta-RFAP synthase